MADSEQTAYDFTVKNTDGQDVSLSKYKGFVTVMVNVASKCGFTDGNYAQLQALYEKYAEQGLRIAAFPCNQFGSQEPNAACEVKKDMANKFKVTFDFYDKIDVNGNHAH
uniref:Glutathione peroxidase n=1 Tax=Romanomermis culicivorax TaxID=13658 RepID=A0A915I0Z2_ROMCU